MRRKVLIVGHISDDLREGKIIPGGPPRYQVPIFLYFGYDVHVITSCTEESPFLQDTRIKITNIPTTNNTTYSFLHVSSPKPGQDDRILKLEKKASELKDLNQFIDPEYDIIIISAIAGEISKYEMELLASKGKRTYLDLQTVSRKIDADGFVFNKLSPYDLDWACETFNVIKASISEIPLVEIANNFTSKLIVTNSGNNVKVYSENGEVNISSSEVKNFLDNTGSGDIFLAVLACQYESHDLLESIRLADKIARSALQIQGVLDQYNVKSFLND